MAVMRLPYQQVYQHLVYYHGNKASNTSTDELSSFKVPMWITIQNRSVLCKRNLQCRSPQLKDTHVHPPALATSFLLPGSAFGSVAPEDLFGTADKKPSVT